MKPSKFDKEAQLVFGLRAIIEAINSGKTIEKILIKQNSTSHLLSSLRQLAKEHNIPIQYVPVHKLNKITNKNHQGAIAYVSPVEFWTVDQVVETQFENGQMPLLVMLDRVTDVRNFGAIVRTAECAGVSGIIVPTKKSALLSGDAMKTSAGALNYVPIIRSNKLLDTLLQLKQMGFQAIAASEKADKYYFDVDFTLPTVIIMGAEDVGISRQLLQHVDQAVKIPVLGQIESLNVSVAAGIIIYEAVRQRINHNQKEKSRQ